MSDPEQPAASGDRPAPATAYDDLPPQAAVAMRRFELLLSAFLLSAFLVILVGNHVSSTRSVAPIETGSLDSWEGWVQRRDLLAPLGLGLLTLALVFVFTWGRRLVESLRAGFRTAAPATIPLGQFLVAYGGLTLVQAGVVSGLPGATLTLERGPTATLAALEGDGQGRVRQVSRVQPLRLGGEALPLEGAGQAGVTVHRETFASWLVVPKDATAAITLDGQRVAPGTTVQVASGAALGAGPYQGVYRAPEPQQILLRFALAQLAALVALLLGGRALGGAGYLTRLGLTTQGALSEVARGAAAWCAFLPIYVLAVIAGLVLAQVIGFPVTGHSLVRTLEREGLALAPLIVFQAVLLAPVTEELLFRGFLLQGYARPLGYRGGLALSAFAFGCIHDGLGPLLPMTALGLLFGGLFVSSPNRSLVGSIAAHALHNGANLALVVLLVTVTG